MPKTVRNTLISVGVLLALMLIAGTLYTLFASEEAKPTPVATTTKEVTASPLKATPPAENSPVGVAIGALSTPVRPGSNASIQIRTRAEATCSITVTYNNVQSTDSGLAPKKANDFGVVDWSWSIGSSVPEGTYPINVTCAYKERSGELTSHIEVNRTALE